MRCVGRRRPNIPERSIHREYANPEPAFRRQSVEFKAAIVTTCPNSHLGRNNRGIADRRERLIPGEAFGTQPLTAPDGEFDACERLSAVVNNLAEELSGRGEYQVEIDLVARKIPFLWTGDRFTRVGLEIIRWVVNKKLTAAVPRKPCKPGVRPKIWNVLCSAAPIERNRWMGSAASGNSYRPCRSDVVLATSLPCSPTDAR